ncbi:HpcH/HpaI aldolase family protein [Bythopirellula goksoeyrii]|uniref:4-hydroxy-2-oxo-heptane-1,7-dioate aldolase n=1 Tax=Bythopirellula goksoeyrii TaxID=1400387 RepID=A0A5B9Q360_9BACT|nr:aldolase/citrate lyase family protein [Bythopirellula goksoeyrii]QEG33434.1 4-hydroxy-2-oxo-heptane-1,7-dioate aldolase [Bythopirellula goksoeyrii]
MRSSTIKAKLARDESVLITQFHLNDPSVYEMASDMGFDGLWMDLEHHGHSLETASHLILASRVGDSDVIARPAKGEFMRMSRLLEAGAQGIMYPRCSNAEEAAEVVRWAKFAPLGTRGFDGAGPDASYAKHPMKEYIQHANNETLIIIQLEDQLALQEAPKIAAVEGIDALMLGPADYSILENIPGEFTHPKILNAMQQVSEAARSAGKQWGMPVFSDEHFHQLNNLGCRLYFSGADIIVLRNGLSLLLDRFAKLGVKSGAPKSSSD